MILFFKFIFNRLRLSDPWNYKAPVLMAVVYIFILAHHIPALVAFKFMLLSLLTIIGIAGYAYLLNDWADEAKDLLANKPNSVNGLSYPYRYALLVLFFVAAALPWLVFPYTLLTIGLLVTELVLFILYSMPPFRLKEQPVLGVLCDALYAHIIPCILAALTFIEIAEVNSNNKIHLLTWGDMPILLTLLFWQFFLGIRNILLHQLLDLENDLKSGTHTFVTKFGANNTQIGLHYFIMPAEVLFFSAFCFYLTSISVLFPISYFVFFMYQYFIRKEKPTTFRSLCYNYFDNYYLDWLALVPLLILTIYDWRFLFLFLFHISIFRNIIREWLLSKIQNRFD